MTAEGNEPLLSAEETKALLDAMRSGSDASTQVESVDLASSERPLRDALGVADTCARVMASAIEKLMLRVTGSSTSTEELPAEIIPYKVVRSSIPQGAAVMTFKSHDGSLGIMIIGPLLVAFILDRRMGAPLSRELILEPRSELSVLDRRLIEPVAASFVELFSLHWCDDAKGFIPGPVLAHAGDLPTMAQFEPLLQVLMRVTPSGVAGDQLTIVLSTGAVSRASALRRREAAPLTATATERTRLEDAIRDTEIEAVAILGQARSSLREVIALKQGDLIRLESIPEEALALRVGGKNMLFGMPIVRHGNLAIQISELSGVKS